MAHYLGDIAAGVRLSEPLAQAAGVALEPATVAGDELEIPDDPGPDVGPGAAHVGDDGRRAGGHEAAEVKVADDAGPQRREHLELLVVVAREEGLLGGAVAGRDGALVVRRVKVDRHPVDVVQRPDEVVDPRVRRQRAHQRAVLGPDPLPLEPDQQVDLRGVRRLQARRLGQVGVVPRLQRREVALRVVELDGGLSAHGLGIRNSRLVDSWLDVGEGRRMRQEDAGRDIDESSYTYLFGV